MLKTVIRKEHKNKWEKRTALIPEDVNELVNNGLSISVEPSDIRIFSNKDYLAQKVSVDGCPKEAELVVGIKEPPVNSIQHNQVHLAFSHTIKGQDYNMPLLQKFIDQKATLLDYEPIVDGTGKRTIAFGRFAGIAGAIDSFFIAGKKMLSLNKETNLKSIKQTWQYASIEEIKQCFRTIDLTREEPTQVIIVGSGNVGKGSEEVCQWLGLEKIKIDDVISGKAPQGSWYAVASSRHINQRIDGSDFEMADFIENGVDAYESSFDRLLGKFNILLQTPYWTDKYPKHLTKERMKSNINQLPLVIGDISCDINGSLECTVKSSDIDTPAFTYFAESDNAKDGVYADGVTVMSIDNLPCELSLDASVSFSAILKNYMKNLMTVDLAQPFEKCGLIKELAGATIVYKGELTPKFRYLQKYLDLVNKSN